MCAASGGMCLNFFDKTNVYAKWSTCYDYPFCHPPNFLTRHQKVRDKLHVSPPAGVKISAEGGERTTWRRGSSG